MDTKWRGICPACRGEIGVLTWPGTAVSCPDCSLKYPVKNDIYQLITDEGTQKFKSFLDDYTKIRHAEGRGSNTSEYYLRLPEPGPSDPLAWQWKIRNQSYQRFYSELLTLSNPPLNVVDIGAGVGWLCHRMDNMGHKPIAIDLSIDHLDGLAASLHYAGVWPRVQAEFDHLPLADDQADMVIFNASLHYSTDYSVTLQEALRVLRGDGIIVIMDSPIYSKMESGELMKAERHRQFEQQYGFRSDTINSIEYLTRGILNELAREFGLIWTTIKPWYGWNWALRPLLARLKGKREPSRFALLIGNRINEAIR